MSALQIPVLHANPFILQRSGLRWTRKNGDVLAAREPFAYAGLSLRAPRGHPGPVPFGEEPHDLQVAFAPSVGGVLRPASALSHGGFQDLVSSQQWDEGTAIGTFEAAQEAELVPLVLAGRRGFDSGEGRGQLLAGWHDRTRAFWEGGNDGAAGVVLSLGICEQTGIFRGEEFAFLEWFARAPGPAQIISIADERTVHSSAVLLQQLNRTPAQAHAIAQAVHDFVGERIGALAGYPAFVESTREGVRQGRWSDGQCVLFAMHLLSEAVSASPLLERTDLITRRGLVDQGPPNVTVLSLGSEFTSHFRHRSTGWLVAMHAFRLQSFIGREVRAWLKRDFEPVRRTVADAERDLAALSEVLRARTGGTLLVQNSIISSPADRIPNYSWLGDGFSESGPVFCAEANLMLSGLTQRHDLSVLDTDALAVDVGVQHCPDRAHPSRVLLDELRSETHRILKDRAVPGF
jgi:hypothetical protein